MEKLEESVVVDFIKVLKPSEEKVIAEIGPIKEGHYIGLELLEEGSYHGGTGIKYWM